MELIFCDKINVTMFLVEQVKELYPQVNYLYCKPNVYLLSRGPKLSNSLWKRPMPNLCSI